jgi:DNA-binding PucR family transcriptional regulator
VRDVFEALEQQEPERAAARARTAGWDPGRPHVVVVARAARDGEPGWSEEIAETIETRLRWLAPSALCDTGPERLRALVPLGPATSDEHLAAELDRVGQEHRVVMGISELRRGIASDVRSLREAEDAARIVHGLLPAGGARGFGALGVYRYLAPLAGTEIPDAVHARAIAALDEYDRRRRTQLVETLDRYLADRGGVLATAKALVIHPNTLRQRLQRIEGLTGLALDREDLLSLEVALKLHRLRSPEP